MQDEVQDKQRMPRRFDFLRAPLFQLLAINLAAGAALAVLVVGGLLALNLWGLRDLILADRSPGTALALLLFGFVVTFGSTVMGSAIMAMGQQDDEEPRRPSRGSKVATVKTIAENSQFNFQTAVDSSVVASSLRAKQSIGQQER